MSTSDPARREPSPEELRALATHAEGRAALYRRKVLLGRGEPRRLAELERVAAGATHRAADRDRADRERERERAARGTSTTTTGSDS
jgi:hypothetical protein